MGSGQRKCGAIVVKSEIGISGRVTGQTKLILILVSAYPAVLLIGFRIEVTGNATELFVVRWILVTFQALHPFILMLSAENGKIPAVVVKGRRNPGRLAVTRSAIIGELSAAVVGIFRIVEVGLMTTHTGIGRVVVSCGVAGLAVGCDPGMCSFQYVKLVVNVKPRGTPAGICGVAGGAIIGQAQ